LHAARDRQSPRDSDFARRLIARLSPSTNRRFRSVARQDVQEIQGQARGGDEAVAREAAGERAATGAGRNPFFSFAIPRK